MSTIVVHISAVSHMHWATSGPLHKRSLGIVLSSPTNSTGVSNAFLHGKIERTHAMQVTQRWIDGGHGLRYLNNFCNGSYHGID